MNKKKAQWLSQVECLTQYRGPRISTVSTEEDPSFYNWKIVDGM